MAGIKGKITRAERGQRRSVYLSDLFGMWKEGANLHLTFLKKQKLHASVTPRDGLLYDALMMLYQYGLRS